MTDQSGEQPRPAREGEYALPDYPRASWLEWLLQAGVLFIIVLFFSPVLDLPAHGMSISDFAQNKERPDILLNVVRLHNNGDFNDSKARSLSGNSAIPV